MSGKVIAATPHAPRKAQPRKSPTGPAASNHSPSTATRASTTRKIPSASRACGERIWWTGVFGGALRRAGRRRTGFFFVRRWLEPRDDERREGEVFVAIGGVSLTRQGAAASTGRSGLHDHRQDHGLSLRHLDEVALQHPSDVLLQGRWVGDVCLRRLLEREDHAPAGFLQDLAVGLLVDEAPVHDVGTVDELAGLGADGDDHDDDAVARELAAIAKHLAADVADPQPVDEGHPRAHPLPLAHLLADLD